MRRFVFQHQKRRRGSIIIGTLFFILITSILLMGIAHYAVSHQTRARVDAAYAIALNIAEAGVNYELETLTTYSTAHVAASPGSGVLGASPWTGTFTVYCTQLDGTPISDPDNPPNTLLIRSLGTVGSATRTVSVRAKKGSALYDYGVFSKISGTINGSQTIEGSVGTAGTVTVNGANGITDKVLGLHGPTASATINPPNSFTTEQRDVITWPTVADIANDMFPFGGLTWLKTANDNNMASAYVNCGILNGSIYNGKTVTPSIVNRTVSANGTGTITLYGKPGGANYYLNSMKLNGNWKVILDNTAGPINIWGVKDTGSGAITFNGGNASVKMSDDPSKACRFYVSDYVNLTLNGNGEGRFGVYAINNSGTASKVILNGNNNLYGSVICNTYTFNGSNTIHYTAGYFSVGPTNWIFDGDYTEINPR